MAKKGLGKGLGAIFGEDVIKESEEEIAKANSWLSWLIPSNDMVFCSPF